MDQEEVNMEEVGETSERREEVDRPEEEGNSRDGEDQMESESPEEQREMVEEMREEGGAEEVDDKAEDPEDAEEPEEEMPTRRTTRSRTARQKETTSSESNRGEEMEQNQMEEDEQDDEEIEEEEEEEETEDQDDDAAKNTSFVQPLAMKDSLIHIGSDYQAVIDPKKKGKKSEGEAKNKREEVVLDPRNEPDREYSIWDCNVKLDREKLDDYVREGCGRYRLPIDRVLYILQKYDHNFERAIIECANRREISEEWAVEEKALFKTAFLHAGKNFKKIHAVIPERSLSSIIQYYYKNKKDQKFKTLIDVTLNEESHFDRVFAAAEASKRAAAGLCENCCQRTDSLHKNTVLKRMECRACYLFFTLMHTPRPKTIRVMAMQKGRKRVLCPEFFPVMKPYVRHYAALSEPADGRAAERLGIGAQPEDEEDTDDCMIVDDCPLRAPSLPYLPNVVLPGDTPTDSNTCRMTRDFSSPEAIELLTGVKRIHHPCVPLIWRVKQTKCMEDMLVINEEARKLCLSATMKHEAVKSAQVMKWKADMDRLRGAMSKMAVEDEDVRPPAGGAGVSSRSGKIRIDSNWTKQEKMDVIKCFHWYRKDFDFIAGVMGTKNSEHVKAFYEKHAEIIDRSIAAYAEELETKLRGEAR